MASFEVTVRLRIDEVDNHLEAEDIAMTYVAVLPCDYQLVSSEMVEDNDDD